MEYNIDIIEQNLLEYNRNLLEILLKDHTTGANIKWATDDYCELGELYIADSEITSELITGAKTNVIQPRVAKNYNAQQSRTRKKAEVFTPSWLCNAQNNLIDEEWFNRKEVFNKESNKSWVTNEEPVEFPNVRGKTWQDYIDARRLEVSCGEAPYLVSRYDTVTGNTLSVPNRIGLLDRKLRIINENAIDANDWYHWVMRAYQSIYGFEYQGDSVLLARENLLYTFIDNFKYKYNDEPNLLQVKKIATIISWNIWQMDGIENTAPYSKSTAGVQISMFDMEEKSNEIACVIMDWRSNEKVEYKSLIKGGL